MQGDRAFLSIGFMDYFCLVLPRGGRPEDVCKLLQAAMAKKSPRDSGSLAASLCALAGIESGIRLTKVSAMSALFRVVDWYYHLDLLEEPQLEVWKVREGAVDGKQVFVGNLDAFVDWAEEPPEFRGLIQKVVQFQYEAGSEPGGVRTVRVENVLRDNGKVCLEGYDLGKPELKRAFRRYLKERIRGDIKVLN